jgi:hypothetical protein
MRLHEFEQTDPEKARVDRMKDTANVAKEKAKQLSQQASASAETLKMKQSKQKPVSSGMIKPQ